MPPGEELGEEIRSWNLPNPHDGNIIKHKQMCFLSRFFVNCSFLDMDISQLSVQMRIEEWAVCTENQQYGFFVVCSFSTLTSRAVFTSLSIRLIQKGISPLVKKKKKNTNVKMDIESTL